MPASRAPILFLSLLLPACAGSTASLAPPPPDPSEGLKELGEVYKYRAAQQLPPPARLEDLGDQQAVLGNAWPLVESGAVVVVWRTGYAASSADVLAYEKPAPTGGGKVLLRNGTVKQMTASEFAAAKPR